MQINIKVDFQTLGIRVSYKVILSLLMGMMKCSQSTQSNTFAMSLQYLKKEVTDGIYFLYADTSKFLQVGIIIFDGSGQRCPKYLK